MDNLDLEIFDYDIKQYYEASKTKRTLNFIIDYIFYYGLAVGSAIAIAAIIYAIKGEEVLASIDDTSFTFRFFDYLFTAGVMLTYYTMIEYFTKGKSIGKYITKTRAVMRSGHDMTLKIALKRSACRIIPFNAFSFLGELKNGWHDSIPGTKVIDERQPIYKHKAPENQDGALYDFLKQPDEASQSDSTDLKKQED